MGLVRENADWTGLLKVARQPGGDDEAWGADLLAATRSVLEEQNDFGFTVVEHNEECTDGRPLSVDFTRSDVNLFQLSPASLQLMGVGGFRRYFYPERHVTTHREIERGMTPEAAAPVVAYRAAHGLHDAVGLLMHPDPGIVMVLCALVDRPVRLSRSDRALLTCVALHLEASYRLRRRPESVRAELDERGRVLHREPDAPPSSELTAHAERVTRAQSRHTTPEQSLELWPALLAGRFSLVERGSGKGKRYLVVDNAPAAQPMRALDAAELEVVTQASRGLPTKLVAYALGISPSTVSTRMTSAASKIGVATRMELVRLAATLTRDPRGGFERMALTDAERDVLDLLQLGLSNDEIARMRSRSVRTIANQVASLLRKTGRASRRGLFASEPAST